MAKHHASVAYVEPNDVFSGLTHAANDGNWYDRAPDLEDYCIYLDIEVELSSREDAVRENTKENNVIIMSYRTDKDGSSVNFMSGSKLNIGGVPNMLTSKYADMFVTDLVDYGTTEMVGIKSVDIEYNNACVPIITIKFTDVRGMSLFQPTELNNNKSYNGIRGFSKDNIAQCFFHSFFVLPLPKFTVRLKGFYGRPVSYEVMCDKFDAQFNSKTGDFDVTARFIGFAYSFMSDISFDALLAAPYSDYVGDKYWSTNVENKRFTLPDKTGEAMIPMPKLYEIRKYFKTLLNESDTKMMETSLTKEDMYHELELIELNEIRRMFIKWYQELYTIAAKKYGKDFVYAYGNGDDDNDFDRIIILTNGKNISGSDLSGEYLQYDDSFKELNTSLYNKIEKFNESNNSYRKISNVSIDFSKYAKAKVFNDLWYNSRLEKIKFDGFHRDNILPREDTIKVVFGDDEEKSQKKLRKIYDDGVSQYVDAFIIEQNYSDIKRRIDSLIEDANRTTEDKERNARLKEHNRNMFEKMGWYPSIENFTKIVMAHLETLMAMMFDVIDQTKERTASQLGVTIGSDGNCCDVNSSDEIIPPFPRITKLVTDSDGITKREDVWAGEFKKGIGFKEVDMINGILNAVAKINQIENQINATQDEQNKDVNQPGNGCVVKYPLTSFDFFLTKNPYGNDKDISNDKYAFAGKVCMRMFDILSINSFRKEFTSNWLSMINEIATTEAENFYNLVKITNVNLMSEIGENGSISSGKKIINVVNGSNVNDKMPWSTEVGVNGALFGEGNGFWLERYRAASNTTYIYPLQDMSFSRLEETLRIFDSGQVQIENNDISINAVTNYSGMLNKALKSKTSNMFNSLFIGKYKDFIKSTLENAAANAVEGYKGISEKIIKASEFTVGQYQKIFCSNPNNVSAFNGKLAETHREDKVTFKDGTKDMLLYVGNDPNAEGEKYNCSEAELSNFFQIDVEGGAVNNATITESFGYKYVNYKYEIDKNTSLFLVEDYYNLKDWKGGGHNFSIANTRSAFFLMGLDCFSYNGAAVNLNLPRTFCHIPNLLALQIGVVLAVHASNGSVELQFNETAFNKIRGKIHVSSDFEHYLTTFLNTLNPFARISFIRYFLDWSNKNYNTIAKYLHINHDKNNNTYKFASPTCYVSVYSDKNKIVHRSLFNQDSAVIKNLTNDLMLPVMVVRGTVNAGLTKNGQALPRTEFKIDKSQAEVYLDAFLKRLRELLKLGQPAEETNNATTIAKEPSQTNTDMQIELYRYLKQVFDKWIPTTDRSEWKYESFFQETTDNIESTGHLFHFIDSYYNKVGSKLLINPLKLANKINLSTAYGDVNVMMFNFLAEVFAEHRCMMKCIQNFRDLSDGMEDLFQPIPYLKMGTPKKHPDFVVVYTYAASKNLNVANGEFNDDGFMLNDELDTPLAIRSRGGSDDRSNEASSYYKIPAFGVSYGRQYQSYFKDVNVNMSNPIMTQQAIVAKHAILAASRNEKSKIVTAQDLYDIYTNQSYTCRVEMMGCAWIQPLMYFVLLNIPMFRGSYMIMKVTHRLRPGDMSTEILGCRMANISNKLVEDIFTEETDENTSTSDYSSDDRSKKADVNNDCPYKVFPVSEDVAVGEELTMTDKEKNDGVAIMNQLIGLGASESFAAGIVGNMYKETYGKPTFNPATLNPNDEGYLSGGLCQWRAGNLLALINNQPGKYGQIKPNESGLCAKCGKNAEVKKKLESLGVNGQVKFLIDTITQPARKTNWVKDKYTLEKFNNISSNPEEAAKKFREIYEISAHCDAERWKAANTIYNAYKGTSGGNKVSHDTKNFAEMFFNAVQKTASSSPSTSVKLKPTYKEGNLIMFQQEDGNTNKLAGVFDILLNGYYQYIQNLNWMYKNSYGNTEEPIAIVAAVSESVKVANRSIWVVQDSNQQASMAMKFGTVDKEKGQINEKLLRSIAKRYPDPTTNQNLTKECPQFRDIQDIFKDYEPEKCDTLYGEANTTAGNVSTPSSVAGSDNIMIDGWDVGKACHHLISHAHQSTVHECAAYVEQAIAAGGGPLKNKISTYENGGDSYHATNLRYYGILENRGFEMINSGVAGAYGDPPIKLQSGDVAVIGKNAKKEGGKFHAVMYCSQGWISDFKQKHMSPYGSEQPYAVYRFHNKQGTPKSA